MLNWLSFLDSVLAAIITGWLIIWQSRRRERKEKTRKEAQDKSIIEGLISAVKHLETSVKDHGHKDLSDRIKTLEDNHNQCQISTQKTLENMYEKFEQMHESILDLKKVVGSINTLAVNFAELKANFVGLEKYLQIQIDSLQLNKPEDNPITRKPQIKRRPKP